MKKSVKNNDSGMMKLSYYFRLTLLLFLFPAFCMAADGVPGAWEFVVHLKNGSTLGYALSTKPRLTVEEQSVVLVTTETTVTYAFQDIQKFTLEDVGTSGVGTLKGGAQPHVERQAGQFVLTGCAANTPIRIYTLDGQQWLSVQTNDEGSAVLPAASLPKGVSLVSVGGASIRVLRK